MRGPKPLAIALSADERIALEQLIHRHTTSQQLRGFCTPLTYLRATNEASSAALHAAGS